ncbi:3beta-hydroxysteroid-dehydrogenase/decarboxylase isoform X2 [Punica granatum]|uniref:Reticulon-like protein n=1 Tax=Punica granatum TaxID=22663 RepID=A0A6P8EEC6_PUNGR|nr:3beta-hydroxysteroid-dehydrogenase/decarboxylase isoform X2 [Punica granatum]
MALIDDYWSDDPIPRGTCVVIGGRGFVGRWLVFRLLKLRRWVVRVADSSQSLQLDPSSPLDSALSQALSSGRASYHSVDVRHRPQIVGSIEGSSVVFYLDVEAAHDQDFYTCYMNIVQGAKNVIDACRECKVKRLIYYSSADVVFDGSCDIYSATESIPYPSKYNDMWSELKAQAEALVLFANDIDGLLTCALRPSNVFGPGETQFMPFLIKQAKSGWTKFIVGTGENMSDFTYVENVAHAHVCAEEALDARSVSVAGKAFFVTNSEPMKFWKFVSLILEGLGYQRPFIKLPVMMVHYILLFGEWLHKELGVTKHNHMRSSHYVVSSASRTRTFDSSAAREQIGYTPAVTLEEGISRTVESFSHLARDPSYMDYTNLSEQSKADKLLGSGKVADILLWRDEKTTFTCFLTLVLLFYWFFLSGRTFISSTALLLLTMTIVSLGYGYLPSNISIHDLSTRPTTLKMNHQLCALIRCGFSVPVASPSCFEIEENLVRESIRSIVYVWNRGIRVSRLLARGEDWNIFLKAAAYLCFLKFVIARHLTTVLGAALVFSFTSFFVYEQYEAELDAIVKVVLNRTRRLKGQVLRYFPIYVGSLLL